jgi:GWxTD domain-containing protein
MLHRLVNVFVWTVVVVACALGVAAPNVAGALPQSAEPLGQEAQTPPLRVSVSDLELDRSSVPQKQVESLAGYNAFLAYLNRAQQARTTFTPSVVRRQLDALEPVLPDSMAKRLRLARAQKSGDPSALAPGAGTQLVRWWRRADPFPATPRNERLHEHLKRTQYAFEHYAQEDNSDRLDDRGRVYVRLGDPDRRIDLTTKHGGEFWVYGLHNAAEFVFVRDRGDGYEFGIPTDFLPGQLRRGIGPTNRGLRKAIQAISLLESVYEELSHYRSRYGITFSDLSMYKEQIQQALTGLPPSFNIAPHTFVNQKLEEIRIQEHHAAQKRKKTVPQMISAVGRDLNELPVAARWVRSLTEDGQTTVDVYWSVRRGALSLSSNQREAFQDAGLEPGSHYLLSSSVIQLGADYELQTKDTHHLLLPGDPEAAASAVETQRVSFPLRDTTRHAALQVDELWVSIDDADRSVRPHARIGVGTARADSLMPLDRNPSTLEMSDLQPVRPGDSPSLLDAPVYPFPGLTPSTPLALRFDLYHLSTGEDGRTQYTVEYDALRKTDRKGFFRLFQGDEREQTAVASTFEGQRRRTTEAVLLDVSSWDIGEAQDVRITVRVTDHHTGQQVERSIAFRLNPSLNE